MADDLSRMLTGLIEREQSNLRALTEDGASLARGPGKWSPKEEIGHLLDSAANNHVRFAGAAIHPEFRGPTYEQDEWVRLHGYHNMAWEAILNLWVQYNTLIAELVRKIPEDRLARKCTIDSNPAVTLGFLIEDYVLHMQHHIDLLLRRDKVTSYPGAMSGV